MMTLLSLWQLKLSLFLVVSLVSNIDSFCSAAESGVLEGGTLDNDLPLPLPLHEERRLGDDDVGPYVYSKMAVLAPDPLLFEDEAKRDELHDKFGKWHFWDGDEGLRPTKEDYMGKYKYRDMPGEDIDDEAWQADAVFVNHILNDGEKIVSRAMEAIYTDFGRGKPLPPDGLFERAIMFKTLKIDLKSAETTSPPTDRTRGGWTTKSSHDGLVRRLVHAMHTNDDFVIVLGGDAAAAGHSNHFRQSYLMHFHRILSPIFARMGVKLVTRNMAMGRGLGTLQSSLGFSSLYGQDIDVLIWDSGMTEASDSGFAELFFRQGLMSEGKQGKIPFLIVGGNSNGDGLFDLLRMFHNEADTDVGHLGTATFSVPQTESAEQAKNLPKVFQFVNCTSDARLCLDHAHCTNCWIDRSDIKDPKTLFPHLQSGGDDLNSAVSLSAVAGSWYPGWRHHLLLGRALAFWLLDGMQDAIELWSSGTMGGPPLDDDEWHVASFYDNMRTKLKTLLAKEDAGRCKEFALEYGLPPRICSVPMKGATEHTPRPSPNRTSLTSLISGKEEYIPVSNRKVSYPGQDVHNQCLDGGEIDVAQVVNLRRNLAETSLRENMEDPALKVMPLQIQQIQMARRARNEEERNFTLSNQQQPRILEGIELGKGWAFHAEKPGQCDGEYLSICGRDSSDSCPLLGYHDSPGELVGNDACDWLVLNLPDFKEGIIAIKIAFYNTPDTSSNRKLRRRRLNSWLPEGDDFVFEFAIDGKTTTWSKDELSKRIKTVHKHMQVLTLVDDTAITNGESKTLPLAMRVKGCIGSCVFALSHVYWA